MRTGDVLVERARSLRDQVPGLSGAEAYRRALAADPGLAAAHHAGDVGAAPAPAPTVPAEQDPGAALLDHASVMHRAGRYASFAEALSATRTAFPALAAAYHAGRMVETTAPAADKIGAPLVLTFRQALAGELLGARMARVVVFRTGRWNGKDYDGKALDAMVRAAAEAGYRIPLKIGHTEEPGVPAVGYVERVWREGDQLLADLAALPAEVVQAIREHRLLSLSCEVWMGLERNGKRFSHALRSIALLGGHPPGVDLPPLADFLPPAA